MSRPEHQAPPELFYDETEARKYTRNSHMIEIQSKISERALELLCLPPEKSCFLLDVGCGSGLSGEVLTENGHFWVGLDISPAMLDVAVEREMDGDLILGDMGLGLPFRPGSFDGAISISAIQWLCHASTKAQNPPRRLYRFFSTLYAALSRGSRASLQLYPENSAQIELIMQQAMKAGFTGGLVVDYPESTKAKKMYLVLFTGGSEPLPQSLGTESEHQRSGQVPYAERREIAKKIRGKPPKKSRDWIVEKKERARRRGEEVRADTKYTGRKRPAKF
jgi:18S rRNA (guanine1575-N7)-methyltransferase